MTKVDLAAADDATIVSIGFADEWTDSRTVVHLASVADVRRTLARRGVSWRRHFGAMLHCEAEQYAAALAAGVDPASMCFRVTWRRAKPAGQLARRWFGTNPELLIRHRGPKLAIASIYAAPTAPTSFDLQRIQDFGYRDPDHVRERIARWNAAGNLPLLGIDRCIEGCVSNGS